ncbi:HTH domain-containing protein [Halosimplex pelagicum]|uniref:Uncharacterized protein n=1 Tax=Halosimplex pelagicum TaxID=869886 RepID=A0A7D5PCH9_9EURY|nr:HTH domain-containing protein [Halosimplex pelagicum]QLH83305.1 hypothetical protein HZS54_17430 [Halosimplex pelagicum]
MQGGTDANGTRVEAYVRSLRAGEESPQRRALDRLDALAAAGEIEGHEVVVWGDRAPPSPEAVRTRAGRFVLDRVTVFERWAERNDASIEDAFGVRTVDSSLTGETHAELVLPRLAVAAVRDGRLLAVAPATVDDEHRSVGRFLDGLEDGALPGERSVEIRPLRAARTAGTPTADDRDRPEPPETAGETAPAPVAREEAPTPDAPPAEPMDEEPPERTGGRGGDAGPVEGEEGAGDPARTPYPPY